MVIHGGIDGHTHHIVYLGNNVLIRSTIVLKMMTLMTVTILRMQEYNVVTTLLLYIIGVMRV